MHDVGKMSAIELIFLRGHKEFFNNKLIVDLFERKWIYFAEIKVRQRFFYTLLYLGCLAYFCVLRQSLVACGCSMGWQASPEEPECPLEMCDINRREGYALL